MFIAISNEVLDNEADMQCMMHSAMPQSHLYVHQSIKESINQSN